MNRERYVDVRKKKIQEKLLLSLYGSESPITIFDIGACEGLNAIRYSEMFPNSTVYAVEPRKDNIGLIFKYLKEYETKNVNVVELCFSDKVGTSEFHVSSSERANGEWDLGNKSSSLLPPDKHHEEFPWIKFDETIEVETTTLDDFCDQNKIDHIEFIHMDVQGAEMMVLNGASKMIQNLDAIWLEVEVVSLYKNQPLKNEIEKFFKKWGFVKIADTINFVSGDQFWIKKEVLDTKKSKAWQRRRFFAMRLKMLEKKRQGAWDEFRKMIGIKK